MRDMNRTSETKSHDPFEKAGNECPRSQAQSSLSSIHAADGNNDELACFLLLFLFFFGHLCNVKRN